MRTDPAWEEFAEWVRSRPGSIQTLLLKWPPLCEVRTKTGVTLLIPAPGVTGAVESYFESGALGVVAPLTIPHPVHGWGSAEEGQIVSAEVDPEQLVLIREDRWTRRDVREALGLDRCGRCGGRLPEADYLGPHICPSRFRGWYWCPCCKAFRFSNPSTYSSSAHQPCWRCGTPMEGGNSVTNTLQ